MDYTQYPALAAVALGKKKASLVVKNVQFLDVFNEEWVTGDVAVHGGYIVGVGTYDGEHEIDGAGKFLVPGFVDAHLHLESTLVNPSELIFEALQFGTTTFVVDPHEAGNVSGIAGVQYMIDETADTQAHVYVMAPSCVPAVPGEDTGFVLDGKALAKLKENPRILGLAEVMDIPSTLEGAPFMMEKLAVFDDRVKDGHIIGISHGELQAFSLAGIRTNHEAGTYEEAKAQVQAGIQVFIRQGSAARNLKAIVTGIVEDGVSTDSYSFCTDDKHIEDIISEGHISYNIKEAIALGLDPIKAYKMGCTNACRTYGLHNQGAIAPGYRADFVLLDDVKDVAIHSVYAAGEAVRKTYNHVKQAPDHLLHTIHMGDMNEQRLSLPVEGAEPIINMVPGQIVTKKTVEVVPQEDGYFKANHIYNKIACIERHHNTGRNGVGILKGYGIQNGAIATSVCHDSHNVIVVGDNDADMVLACERIAAIGGGYVIAHGGKIVGELPLEIMGLITNKPHEEVDGKVKEMKEIAYALGVDKRLDPFINLSFLALTVIPEIRVTTRGVVEF